jgi:hypothetical protein
MSYPYSTYITVSQTKEINERQAQKRETAKMIMDEKLERANTNHQQFLNTIRKKAENENSKVAEVAWITKTRYIWPILT